MSKTVSRAVGGLVALSLFLLTSAGVADDSKVSATPTSTVVSISRVTWSLTNPGGVGSFRVMVNTTGPLRAGIVWAQARSAGAPSIQGPVGASYKPGVMATGAVSGTANGRCYTVSLAIEPDSTSAGVKLDPKNSVRQVCLDPDGAGIFN